MANLRDNQRLRKLRKNISDLQEALKAYDMEELARAHRQFNEKYTVEKTRESDKESEVSETAILVSLTNIFMTIVCTSWW